VKEVTGKFNWERQRMARARPGDEDEGSSLQKEAKRTAVQRSVKIERSAEALRVRHSPDIFPSN
jgi:hypothetical protein